MFDEVKDRIFTDIIYCAAELGAEFKKGPNKTVNRCMEKSTLAYHGDYSLLKDLRRASVVCFDIEGVVNFVKRLRDDPELSKCILRSKNRFALGYKAKEESLGYRDLQFSMQVPGTRLIWELQIHVAKIEAIKSKLSDEPDEAGRTGHARYVAYRDIYERTALADAVFGGR